MWSPPIFGQILIWETYFLICVLQTPRSSNCRVSLLHRISSPLRFQWYGWNTARAVARMTLQEARVFLSGLAGFWNGFLKVETYCGALWGRKLKDNKKTPFNETGKRSVEGSWKYFRNSPSHSEMSINILATPAYPKFIAMVFMIAVANHLIAF